MATATKAPGTYSTRTTSVKGGVAAPDTGTFFAAGISERGPVDRAVAVSSLAEMREVFGARITTSYLDDAVDYYFRRAGKDGYAVIARNVGAGATAATCVLAGGTGTSLTLTAANPGTWGNTLTADVVAHSTSYEIIVYLDGEEVDRSGIVASRDDAVTAFEESDYVTATIGADTTDPTAGTNKAFTGGTNGTTSSDTRAAALALFTSDFGPGQVAVPGDTATAAHSALLAHGVENNRVPVLDYADASAATSASAIEALWGTPGSDLAVHCVSIGKAPGGPANSIREIPYSAKFAADCSILDGQGLVGQAVAGDVTADNYLTGLVREFTTEERRVLNDAGATVAILDDPDVFGKRRVTTFSDRTGSDRTEPEVVHEASDARTLMAVEARLRHAMRPHRFSQLVQEKQAEITGQLGNIATDLYEAGAIAAEDGGDYSSAFSVEVLMDRPNRTWVVNAYVRPARVGEVIQINVIRQLVEG